jgi:hypothetical protein
VLPGNSQIVSNLFFGLQSGFSWGLLGVCQGASVPDQRVQVQNRFEESKGFAYKDGFKALNLGLEDQIIFPIFQSALGVAKKISAWIDCVHCVPVIVSVNSC